MPFVWATYRGHAPDRALLLLQGGTLHSIPDRVRLLDPTGQLLGTAQAGSSKPDESCLEGPGPVHAILPLPGATLQLFQGGAWPAGYRLEAEVAGVWRPVLASFGGCAVTE